MSPSWCFLRQLDYLPRKENPSLTSEANLPS